MNRSYIFFLSAVVRLNESDFMYYLKCLWGSGNRPVNVRGDKNSNVAFFQCIMYYFPGEVGGVAMWAG